MNALWLRLGSPRCAPSPRPCSVAPALALARGGLPGSRFITAFFLSPLMLPAILTGLALFQSYLLMFGRPLWGLVLGHTLVPSPM